MFLNALEMEIVRIIAVFGSLLFSEVALPSYEGVLYLMLFSRR